MSMPEITNRPFNRRTALTLGAAAAVPAVIKTSTPAAAAPRDPSPGDDHLSRTLAELERRYRVRIGLMAQNLRTGSKIGNRVTERFPLCSTFKPIAAAAVLQQGTDLDRIVGYPESILVDYSPITSLRREMTIADLVDAAARYSDNTAANLLLRQLGGPAGVTRFARSIGDQQTRLDRWETELNSAYPGDPRDTTTPGSIAATYRTMLLGDVLPADRRWLLRAIMQGNTTSVGKFRAALPDGWWFADKTGSGDYGTSNDVGLITAPDGTQIVVAVLTHADRPDVESDPALMVDLGELVVRRLHPE